MGEASIGHGVSPAGNGKVEGNTEEALDMPTEFRNPDCLGSLELQPGDTSITVLKIDGLKALNDEIGQGRVNEILKDFWVQALSGKRVIHNNYKQATIAGVDVNIDQLQAVAAEKGLTLRALQIDLPQSISQAKVEDQSQAGNESVYRGYLAFRFGDWLMGIEKYLDSKPPYNKISQSYHEKNYDWLARECLRKIKSLTHEVIDIIREKDSEYVDSYVNDELKLKPAFFTSVRKNERRLLEVVGPQAVDLVNLVESLMSLTFFHQADSSNTLNIDVLAAESSRRSSISKAQESRRDERWSDGIEFAEEETFHEFCLGEEGQSGVYVQVDLIALGARSVYRAHSRLQSYQSRNCRDLLAQTAGLTDFGLEQIEKTWKTINLLFKQYFPDYSEDVLPVWAKGDEAVIFIPNRCLRSDDNDENSWHAQLLSFTEEVKKHAKELGVELRLATTSVLKENTDDQKRKEAHYECLKVLQGSAMSLAKAFEYHGVSVLVEYSLSDKALIILKDGKEYQRVTQDLAATLEDQNRWIMAVEIWLDRGTVDLHDGKIEMTLPPSEK